MDNEVKGTNKKRNGLIALVILVIGVAIAAAVYFLPGSKNIKVEGIEDTSEVQYQYDDIDPSSIKVNAKGGKSYTLAELPQGYTLASPCYSGENISVYIDDQLYTASLSNYIHAENVTWTYDGKEVLPSNLPEGSVGDASKFQSTIQYADGTTGEVSADYAEITWKGTKASVTLLVGNTTYAYEFDSDGAVNSEGEAGIAVGSDADDADEVADSEGEAGVAVDSDVDDAGVVDEIDSEEPVDATTADDELRDE